MEPLLAAHIAETLIDRFGSLAAVLAADPEVRTRSVPSHPRAMAHLQAVYDAMRHALRTQMEDAPLLTSMKATVDYLRLLIAHELTEQFRVLFLDTQGRLIREEMISHGSVHEAPVYPREIMRRALELGATILILVHNHPSGDPAPSQQDLRITRRLINAGHELDIAIHDHIIVTRCGWASLRALGAIQ